jgi:hypothetical protein
LFIRPLFILPILAHYARRRGAFACLRVHAIVSIAYVSDYRGES